MQEKVQEEMKGTRKSRAFNAPYESTRRFVLPGFETPFESLKQTSESWIAGIFIGLYKMYK